LVSYLNFEHGRLVITVARDLPGLMKIAHKLQSKVTDAFGPVVEVIMEHVKHEWWLKLHESTTTVGLNKGEEVPECQVTDIPDGIRDSPYKRSALPSLEVLLLWDDVSGTTRGHCLFTLAHPNVPSMDEVDGIYAEIEPYFAKRCLIVNLRLTAPVRGEFEEIARDDPQRPPHETHVGPNVGLTVLACHADGFVREQAAVTQAMECKPIAFHGISDDDGKVKLCFLPAAVNKVQVAETESFHGSEMILPQEKVASLHDGPTVLTVELTPKAVAAVTVHVFEMPAKLPPAEHTDGIIDWSEEKRDPLILASVLVKPMKDGAAAIQLQHIGDGVFKANGGVAEGFISFETSCTGYQKDERSVMLLVGENEFYVPLRKA